MTASAPFFGPFRTLAHCAGLSFFLLAEGAVASPEFPTTMEESLELSCTPTCLTCHTQDPGEQGTAAQDFALGLRAVGLQATDSKTLREALETFEEDGTDTDGDGTSDIDELRELTDPNGELETICAEGPEYGCGAHVAPRIEPLSYLWGIGSIVLAALVAFRRRREPRSTPPR